MGDLQSEEERDIVLELMLPVLPGPVEKDLVMKVELSYFNIITSQLETVECQLTVNHTGMYVYTVRINSYVRI